MPEPTKHRFGWMVDEDTAKKFYAVLNYARKANIKANLTDNFIQMVELSYSKLPKGDQDLSNIHLDGME